MSYWCKEIEDFVDVANSFVGKDFVCSIVARDSTYMGMRVQVDHHHVSDAITLYADELREVWMVKLSNAVGKLRGQVIPDCWMAL